MKGYKGFNKDLKCYNNFQYEIGKEYETDKKSVRCTENGFHFCEYPLDIFKYYPPSDSRYCEVEGDGQISRDDNNEDSKVAVSKIRIRSEIGLIDLIKASVKFILERINQENMKVSNTEYRSLATGIDNYPVATNTDNYSAVSNTVSYSVAINTGNCSVATNTGNCSIAANTGDRSVVTNTGNFSIAANTGDYSAVINNGIHSVTTNVGNRSVATNTGHRSVAINIGSGSVATNTGHRSAAVITGDHSVVSVEGKESVAIAIGYKSRAKGALDCWIVLSEWGEDENGAFHIKTVKSAKVDGEKIKADTWYILENGQFVEWE